MTVIDSQVHAYEANTPKRPWFRVPNWPDHVTGDEMVAAMDKVGVDGAIFISPFSMYQYDGSYAVEVQRAHPARFAIIKPVDPDALAVADVIADWKKTPGTVGIRIIMTKESKREPNDPGFDRIVRAAVKHDFPVNVLFWGNVDAGTALIDRHPDTRFIIDHLAIMQPSVPPAPAEPWADLPKVLELAKRTRILIEALAFALLAALCAPVGPAIAQTPAQPTNAGPTPGCRLCRPGSGRSRNSPTSRTRRRPNFSKAVRSTTRAICGLSVSAAAGSPISNPTASSCRWSTAIRRTTMVRPAAACRPGGAANDRKGSAAAGALLK